MVKIFADNTNSNSYSNKLRKKRTKLFLDFLKTILGEKIKILDVGGTENFWKMVGFPDKSKFKITILNIKIKRSANNKINFIKANATDMHNIKSNSYDLIFSNSVIEHVGSFDMQKRMAKEVRRVSDRYFIQTPNKFFPIEPHFLFPFFQFLPRSIKALLIRSFNLGWYKKVKDKEKSYQVANEIRLLTKKELKALFPEGKIMEEKIFGFIKSFIIYN